VVEEVEVVDSVQTSLGPVDGFQGCLEDGGDPPTPMDMVLPTDMVPPMGIDPPTDTDILTSNRQ
jgi:hypothetical protein